MIAVFSVNILINGGAGIWTMVKPTIKKIKRWLFRRKNLKLVKALAKLNSKQGASGELKLATSTQNLSGSSSELQKDPKDQV